VSLRGYQRRTKLAPWKLAQDSADEASGAARQRREEKEGERRAKERHAKERAAERQRNRPKVQVRRIAFATKPRAAELRAYGVRRKQWLKDHPVCEACPKLFLLAAVVDTSPHRSEAVHHKRGRLGPLLLDERHWLAVCDQSHDFIHHNIAVARAADLIAQPGQWNRWEP
jgi:hypothetical protein